MMKVAVRFVHGCVVEGYGSYNTGEVAGFPLDVARGLIDQGLAARLPRATHSLVQEALQYPDGDIRRLAEMLTGLDPKAAALEDRAAPLRALLRDLEKAQARALVLEQPFDAQAAQDVRAQLAEIERQRDVLAAQEEPLFSELVDAMKASINRKYAATAESIAGPLRTIDDLVAKCRRIYSAHVAPGLERMSALRAQAAALNEFGDAAAMDEVEWRLTGEVSGDSLVGITGIRRLPHSLEELLSAIVLHQGRQRHPSH